MVIYENIDLEQLSRQGKSFSWSRPDCPKCNRGMWGHGYVARFFDGFYEALFVKRWRCQTCRIVVVLRPSNYWRRIQTSISKIYQILIYRVRHHKWPPGEKRQKAGHWMNSILKKAKAELLLKEDLLETISFFQQKNLAIF